MTNKMRHYYATSPTGDAVMYVSTDATDLNQRVSCVDNDTGLNIQINGWDVEWEQLEAEDDSE